MFDELSYQSVDVREMVAATECAALYNDLARADGHIVQGSRQVGVEEDVAVARDDAHTRCYLDDDGNGKCVDTAAVDTMDGDSILVGTVLLQKNLGRNNAGGVRQPR
mmetsp:Transcript_12915/g.30195  ORF Transcript_12915/g.30195 Transcript_12915/m.30195 type:complete len:107 (+) Transcript_12915:1293-1613(+)